MLTQTDRSSELNGQASEPGQQFRKDPVDSVAAAEPRDWLLAGSDELFRGIYTRAGFGRTETLAICSAIQGEGKTTIALGVGITLAQDFPRRRVLIVETDLAHPVFATDFDLDAYPGLVDCLAEDLPTQLAYRPTWLPNLQVVPAGGPPKVSGRWLRSEALARALETMRRGHDIVLLDLPALLVNSDAQLLADRADGILYVVRAGATPQNAVTRALGQLDPNKLRGVVLNDVTSPLPRWLQQLCGT